MGKWMLIVVFMLGACEAGLTRAEVIGTEALDTLEASSELTAKGAKRYLCRTGRIGPILDEFDTDQERMAWAIMCYTNPAPPPTLPNGGDDAISQ